MFRKFVCIYLIVYSSIGSNGPFPLPKYCALPIASLDLIVCIIYCLNDSFNRYLPLKKKSIFKIVRFSLSRT